MPIVTRHSLITVVVLAVASLLIIGIFIWSGLYNIGADDSHTRPVYSVLEILRERSIEARAEKLEPPPDLHDVARVRQGAGNYNAMCMGCHLAPGMAATELSKGLYPAPPDLTRHPVGAAEAFWVIKHGIKASGMPAWGKSMDDEYIWNMAAFLQRLPDLGPEQYEALVASSGGHSHGGGETRPHLHSEGAPDHDEGAHASDAPAGESASHDHPPGTPSHEDEPADPHAGRNMSEHRHADGTVESHPAPEPTQADDGHDHEH